MPEQRQYRNFRKKESSLTTEQKIEKFILRNSKNGFFTKVSTIPYKFEISESKSWDVVGELLSNGSLESIHDERTGEMKLCEFGKTYEIMDLERKRKIDRFKNNKRNQQTKATNQTINSKN